jgi:hypothetical protein
MNIPDHISESIKTIFRGKILKFFDADADPRIFLIRDPGWKKFGSGTNIPDQSRLKFIQYRIYQYPKAE